MTRSATHLAPPPGHNVSIISPSVTGAMLVQAGVRVPAPAAPPPPPCSGPPPRRPHWRPRPPRPPGTPAAAAAGSPSAPAAQLHYWHQAELRTGQQAPVMQAFAGCQQPVPPCSKFSSKPGSCEPSHAWGPLTAKHSFYIPVSNEEPDTSMSYIGARPPQLREPAARFGDTPAAPKRMAGSPPAPMTGPSARAR